MDIQSIKVSKKKVADGILSYSAVVIDTEEKEHTVTGSMNAYALKNDVEIELVDNVIMFHIQRGDKVYNTITKDVGVMDFSGLKRVARDLEKTFLKNKDFNDYFKRMVGIAKAVDNTGLLKPITKVSKSGVKQFMPCWMYLCGIKKANVNYLQSDFGLKSSDYEKEKAKEDYVKAILSKPAEVKEKDKKAKTEKAKKDQVKVTTMEKKAKTAKKELVKV